MIPSLPRRNCVATPSTAPVRRFNLARHSKVTSFASAPEPSSMTPAKPPNSAEAVGRASGFVAQSGRSQMR